MDAWLRQTPATAPPARISCGTLPPPQTARRMPPGFADSKTGQGYRGTCLLSEGSAKPPSGSRRPSTRPHRHELLNLNGTRPMPYARSLGVARICRVDATGKRPMALPDAWSEPTRRSDLDTANGRRARQRTPHLPETSWG